VRSERKGGRRRRRGWRRRERGRKGEGKANRMDD